MATGGVVEGPALAALAAEAAAPAALGSGLTLGSLGAGGAAAMASPSLSLSAPIGQAVGMTGLNAGGMGAGALGSGLTATPAMAAKFGSVAPAGFGFGAKDLLGMGMNMQKMGDDRGTPQAPMMMAPATMPTQTVPFSSLNPYTRGGRKVY